MKIGDRVEKISGCAWPGVVVATFTTPQGESRVIVEATQPQLNGRRHEFAPDQLRVVEAPAPTNADIFC